MRLRLLIILLVAPFLAAAQGDWKKLATVDIGEAAFATDNIGQLYSVEGDMLKRFNQEGKLQYNYNNKTFGNISFVDPTNPLRVVVFYKELSQVVFLDNTLAEHGTPISLSELGYDQTTVLCASQNNGIWLFDQVDFDYAREVSTRYPSLPVYLQPGNPTPPVPGKEIYADQEKIHQTMDWLVARTIEEKWYQATVLPQLHVMLWDNKRGV